jgi:hypothetical protein
LRPRYFFTVRQLSHLLPTAAIEEKLISTSVTFA